MSEERKFMMKILIGFCSGGLAVGSAGIALNQHLTGVQFNSFANHMKMFERELKTELKTLERKMDVQFEAMNVKFDAMNFRLDAALRESSFIKEMLDMRLEAQRRTIQESIDSIDQDITTLKTRKK